MLLEKWEDDGGEYGGVASVKVGKWESVGRARFSLHGSADGRSIVAVLRGGKQW
jgi:hypothetical protein